MKRLFFCITFILLIMAIPRTAQAARVTGLCSNCHTMHDSESGEPVAFKLNDTYEEIKDGPYVVLLKTDCIGCHASTTAGSSAIDADGVPIVFNTGGYTGNTLAGGNFKDMAANTNGHNIVGISSADANYSGSTIPGSTTSYSGNQVTCAGTKGCHGNRDIEDQAQAMEGAHHTDDSGGITGASVGLSYRFLKGILGKEDTDWEHTVSTTDHNEYKGAGSPPNFEDNATISYLCGQCHGNTGAGGYHSSLGAGGEAPPVSPWIRHPTDNALPGTGEYASYTTYSTLAPVARPDPDNVTDHDVVTPGTDIVMCLTCHRAHASPYDKMLRWDYKDNSPSSALSGCNVCHTSKADSYIAGAHGDHADEPDTGVNRLAGLYPRGSCAHCHTMHKSTDPVSYSLFQAYSTVAEKQSLCESCHDGTIAPLRDHTLNAPYDYACADCHDPHEPSITVGSHLTHTGEDYGQTIEYGPNITSCFDCHKGSGAGGDEFPLLRDGSNNILFNDDSSLSLTNVCDTCHSQNGAYNGVTSSGSSVGAKNNWTNGVYDDDVLATGKEKWCLGCHDEYDHAAWSKADDNSVRAPNIAGDDSTYGYYATGHGKNDQVDCSDCHDLTATHIDHDARTYDAGVTVYCDSYRLRYIGGTASMTVPRSGAALANWTHFALCFDCHNRYNVIGSTSADVSNTNFYDSDTSPNNSHWYHLGMNTRSDTDFDGTIDSAVTCITCHNVHGSPTGPMIRHGELISPPGTTSYVPAFNFYYMVPGDGAATATFTPTLAGGTYNVYAWWTVDANRATNAKYLVNHNGGQAEVVVNQEQNGEQWNLLGQYTFAEGTGSVVLTSEGANQYVFADAVRWRRTDGADEVIVDDPAAAYQGTWTELTSNPNQYGSSQRYYYAPIKDATATQSEAIGGKMQSGNLTSSHLCNT